MWNKDDLFELGRDTYLKACARVNLTSPIDPIYRRTKYDLANGHIILRSDSRPLWEGTFDEAGNLLKETLF